MSRRWASNIDEMVRACITTPRAFSVTLESAVIPTSYRYAFPRRKFPDDSSWPSPTMFRRYVYFRS